MKRIDYLFIENNLLYIYEEMLTQDMSEYDIEGYNTWQGTMEQIFEFIDLAGEYALAYEYIIHDLRELPYKLSGKASIKLLELGLIFRYKSELEEDVVFDLRECCKDCEKTKEI